MLLLFTSNLVIIPQYCNGKKWQKHLPYLWGTLRVHHSFSENYKNLNKNNNNEKKKKTHVRHLG